MYNQKIMNILLNPLNVGVIRGASGIGIAEDSINKDLIKIYLLIENDRIIDAKFKTFGSVASIVCSSVACGLIINKKIVDALVLDTNAIIDELEELPSQKINSICLVKEAIYNAIQNYFEKLRKIEKKSEQEICDNDNNFIKDKKQANENTNDKSVKNENATVGNQKNVNQNTKNFTNDKLVDNNQNNNEKKEDLFSIMNKYGDLFKNPSTSLSKDENLKTNTSLNKDENLKTENDDPIGDGWLK